MDLSSKYLISGVLPAVMLVFSERAARPDTLLAGAELRRDETVRAIERSMPSVVNISGKTVVRRQGYLYDWWRNNWAPFYQDMPPQYSAGSGVIVDEEGYIVTCLLYTSPSPRDS